MPLDPTKISKTLDAAKTVVLTGDAVVGDVKAGKKFYKDDPETQLTGTMPTKAIVATSDDYEAGYHEGNPGGLDAIDTDLAPANIKAGVTIFGKLGTYVEAISELFWVERIAGANCTNWDVPGMSGTVPANALRVIIYGSMVQFAPITPHSIRALYNDVQKCTVDGPGDVDSVKGMRWTGAGIGSDATVKIQLTQGGGGCQIQGVVWYSAPA
ncbi:hypothetical protein ES703_20797 [subsurface metagenome]